MKAASVYDVHTEGVELTLQSLQAYWPEHEHFAIAWSGGKDSTALLTLTIHLIDAGLLPQPECLWVFYADPLWAARPGRCSMTMNERLADWTPTRLIEHIAAVSEDMAWQAGVGGRETAGAIISYLALKPEHIEPFLNGGIMELPSEWIDGGRLTWQIANGRVVHPDEARAAREAKRIASGSAAA